MGELRQPEESVRLIEAVLLEKEYLAQMLDTQAAALAAAGRFDEAVAAANRALEIARRDPKLARDIRERRELYARGEAYVEAAPTAAESAPPVR